ncbi:hypothetical protein H2204_004014 [Knufia peltigerae]|uniref:NADP-dependent oxidoreductase domain-containing protein n=1 Tax=Knufia peltigerae TaxID=1002370 RepID=A0AA38Y8A1_9EURO|nr:hypothetical protein H2204_004014 [Knufia peltigerae]
MSHIPTRQLGRNGPQVTALGFGALGLSTFYGKPQPDEERFAFLDHAHKVGARNWDTADVYGDNEDLIGEWFRRSGKRDDIFLATKFATVWHPDGTRTFNNEPGYVKEACEKSLNRLGIETIDLYYCHRLSGKTAIEDMVEAMADLVKQGKVRYLGLSECSAESLRRAHKIHPISAVQVEYSPFTTELESPQIGLLDACRELGVAVVAYSPLGRGFLTGQYRSLDDFDDDDIRRTLPRFSPDNFHKNLELVDRIGSLADKKGCTAGQLTLAWLMAQGEDVIPIPGTKKIKYLDDNMGALNVKLTPEENREIRKAIESAEVSGSRYPPFMQAYNFMDTPERS